MISRRAKSVGTAVLNKDYEFSLRMAELREKIYDETYINNAIGRIAQVISRKLVEDSFELQFRE